MTGRPADQFADVIVKELVDNALDAAETAGRRPEVGLAVVEDNGSMSITVTDNGPGLSAGLVKRVLDFSVLVSDKAAYRAPTRGQQGNALKTVIGISTALGSAKPLIIESCGLRHAIRARLDPAGAPRIDHQRDQIPKREGAAVTVTIPTVNLDGRRWMSGFALVNPHATLCYQGNSGAPGEVVFYKPTAPEAWRKPVPGDPTSAHHYDEPAMANLIFSHINARRRRADLPLGEFVRSFAGLSGTAKAKQVTAAVPHISHLSDFEADHAAVGILLAAMQSACRAPKPKALGQVDEAHYRDCFRTLHGAGRFWFKRVTTFDGTVPWVIEVAFAETVTPGDLFYAVNYSPTFDDPLTRLPLSAGELRITGAASMLRHYDAFPDGESLRAAAVHLISPSAAFLDKGKSTLAVD